jgi:prepilin signal peptidase PulO-like enzyme (type II secretory pathway)
MLTADVPTWLLSLMLAPFGLALGSFANVLIRRLPLNNKADRNIITKPSQCMSCKANIRPQHNLPILSWMWLKGKCAYCGCQIPIGYPLVELIVGCLITGSVWIFPFGTLVWAKGVVCGYALIVLFCIDFNELILPDRIQFPLMATGVLLTLPQLVYPSLLYPTCNLDLCGNALKQVDIFANSLQPAPIWHTSSQPVTLQTSLLGLVMGYMIPMGINLIYHYFRKRDGMGRGDFKMLAWLGAFWGWAPMLGIVFSGALLGSIIGLIVVLVTKGNWRNTVLPFGCILALVTPIVIFYGPKIWHIYMALIW